MTFAIVPYRASAHDVAITTCETKIAPAPNTHHHRGQTKSAVAVARRSTAANNQTVRTVFVIGPDKKIKLTISYPMSTGRNFDEILRVIDSMQLSAQFQVSTPVNWKNGDDVIIAGSVTDEQAKLKYPDGWKTVKPYLRIVKQPK